MVSLASATKVRQKCDNGTKHKRIIHNIKTKKNDELSTRKQIQRNVRKSFCAHLQSVGCRFDSCHQLQKDLKTENVLGSFAVIESAFFAVKRRKIENDRKRENPWKK